MISRKELAKACEKVRIDYDRCHINRQCGLDNICIRQATADEINRMFAESVVCGALELQRG